MAALRLSRSFPGVPFELFMASSRLHQLANRVLREETAVREEMAQEQVANQRFANFAGGFFAEHGF